MPKKIYDIKPPKAVRKAEKTIKDFIEEGRKAPVEKKKTSGRKKENKSLATPLMIGSVVVVLIICVVLYFKLPKVDIKIWPKVDTLSFQQTITADKTAELVDVTKNVVPAQYFEVSKDASQDFPATGNADDSGKATGTITVFNKYNPPAPFTLKAGTRFVSDSGKLFVTLQKIVIPAATKSGSKITAGTIQVKVEAAEGGDSYNIAPSNFSVPGLKGTAYYFSVNATSSSAMTGGYSGKVKKVTADDIQQAKDVLVKRLTEEAKSALKSQISNEYILLDNAISSDTVSAATQTKVGTATQNFSYQAKVKASALAFKKSDLEQYAKSFIISQMPEGKTLLDNSFTQNYSTTSVDISGGKINLNFNFSSGVYQNIDKNSLALSLFGENSEQINKTINNILGDNASQIKVDFWPFWVKTAPNSQKAVRINLQF